MRMWLEFSSTGLHCTDNRPLLLAQGMVKPQLMRLNSVEILGKETTTVCYSRTHPGNGLLLCEIEASNNEHGDSPTINRLRDFQFPDVTEELSTLHPCKSCLWLFLRGMTWEQTALKIR